LQRSKHRLSHPPERGKTIGPGPITYHLVSATSHELSNGFLTNSNALRDLTVGMSLEIEILDQLPSRSRRSRTSTRVTGGPVQRSQSSILEASLVSSHSACGTAKSSRHVGLIRQALVHKVHHGIGLGHVIAQGVLCQNDPAGNHHSMAILGPHQALIVNRAGAFGVPSVWQDAGTGTRVSFVV
jgi:hypothetical protein